MNGINTFIFDMGNVLIDYNPFRIMEEIVGDWEAIPEIMAATLFSPLWIELAKGAVSACTCFPTLHCAFINIKTVFR